MSKWLGLGMRQALPSPPMTGDTGKKLAAKEGNNRIGHPREPTVDTQQASPRSLQASQASHNACNTRDTNGYAADGRGAYGDGTAEHGCEDGWVVLEDAALQGRDGDRPLSPGVDLMRAKAGGGSEEAAAGEECLSGKWVDAGSIHSFLVRGATYLTVRGFRLCMCIVSSQSLLQYARFLLVPLQQSRPYKYYRGYSYQSTINVTTTVLLLILCLFFVVLCCVVGHIGLNCSLVVSCRRLAAGKSASCAYLR